MSTIIARGTPQNKSKIYGDIMTYAKCNRTANKKKERKRKRSISQITHCTVVIMHACIGEDIFESVPCQISWVSLWMLPYSMSCKEDKVCG